MVDPENLPGLIRLSHGLLSVPRETFSGEEWSVNLPAKYVPALKKLQLKLGLFPAAFKLKTSNSKLTQFYYVTCSKHGYYVDYKHGVDVKDQYFICPACDKESLKS